MDFNVTPVFERNFKEGNKIVVNRGGTRSSKTYSICQQLVHWLFTGYLTENKKISKGFASVVRKTRPALKATAYRDIKEIIDNLGLSGMVKENKSELVISYNDRHLEFFSVDNQQKVRGRKRDILYCNEANELSFKQDFYQLLFRTREKVIIDFNPDDPNVWINTELEQKRAALKKDVGLIVSTYKDNGYLLPEERAEIEFTKQIDPELWEVFGKGNYGKITGLVFPSFVVIDEFPEGLSTDIYGLDFGYNDPLALIRVGADEKNLYLDEEYFQRFKTIPDVLKDWEGKIDKRRVMFCDHRPGQIKELKDAGYKATKAQKGKDSIIDGLNLMKGYRIHVTARSENLKKELRRYKWLTSPEGETLDKQPIDQYNHAIDGARYGIYSYLFKPKREISVSS